VSFKIEETELYEMCINSFSAIILMILIWINWNRMIFFFPSNFFIINWERMKYFLLLTYLSIGNSIWNSSYLSTKYDTAFYQKAQTFPNFSYFFLVPIISNNETYGNFHLCSLSSLSVLYVKSKKLPPSLTILVGLC
jgi:hypothetical protein